MKMFFKASVALSLLLLAAPSFAGLKHYFGDPTSKALVGTWEGSYEVIYVKVGDNGLYNTEGEKVDWGIDPTPMVLNFHSRNFITGRLKYDWNRDILKGSPDTDYKLCNKDKFGNNAMLQRTVLVLEDTGWIMYPQQKALNEKILPAIDEKLDLDHEIKAIIFGRQCDKKGNIVGGDDPEPEDRLTVPVVSMDFNSDKTELVMKAALAPYTHKGEVFQGFSIYKMKKIGEQRVAELELEKVMAAEKRMKALRKKLKERMKKVYRN